MVGSHFAVVYVSVQNQEKVLISCCQDNTQAPITRETNQYISSKPFDEILNALDPNFLKIGVCKNFQLTFINYVEQCHTNRYIEYIECLSTMNQFPVVQLLQSKQSYYQVR